MEFTKNLLCIAFVLTLLSFGYGSCEEVANDGTVGVTPDLDSIAAAPPEVVAANQPAHPAPVHEISGTTTETKNPDGSTITVTHFRGQLPPGSAVPGFSGYPYPAFQPYPFYGYPHPFFPHSPVGANGRVPYLPGQPITPAKSVPKPQPEHQQLHDNEA